MYTSSDPKPHTLRVRINDEMKSKLESLSRQSGKKVSECVREILENGLRKR